MKIDWAALGMVAVVAIVATLVFMVLLSLGIRYVSAARVNANQGQASTPTLAVGYAFLGLASVLVLYGLYLIIPQFH